MKDEKGLRRTLWLSRELDAKVEEARRALGLSKSSFYKFAILEQLKSMGQLTQNKNAEEA